MMKSTLIIFMGIAAVAYAIPADSAKAKVEEKYTNKFDGFDIHAVLNNDRLLNNYFKCLMESGRCTAEGTELKKILPDVLRTQCSKCSEDQKEKAKVVVNFLIKNKPELWSQLKAKYDPEDIYSVKLAEDGKKLDISVSGSPIE